MRLIGFGQRLAELRKDISVSQKELADLLEVTVRSYQRYESEEREPTLSQLIKLANYFGVSLDYLCGLSDDPILHRKDESHD